MSKIEVILVVRFMFYSLSQVRDKGVWSASRKLEKKNYKTKRLILTKWSFPPQKQNINPGIYDDFSDVIVCK